MGESPPDVTAYLIGERSRQTGHIALIRLSMLVAFVLLAVSFTGTMVWPDEDMPAVAAFGLTITAWLAAAAWGVYGKRIIDGLFAAYHARNLKLLSRTDLLYLAIEHKPAEYLVRKPSVLNLALGKPPPDPKSFSYRIDDFVKNMDDYSGKLVSDTSSELSRLDCLGLGFTCLPCVCMLAFPVILDVIFMYELVFPAFFLYALTLLCGFAPSFLETAVRWQLVVDVLLGETDLR